ncbi:fungal specific transcription factor domain-containing protein [Colletotrichum graminicola M1.001]|uniref:Fungal specific transcription factor domain-containing protein n=1 Tax=Colletotrichum graminicola (strain M1.001 / M2 / FGSC 10212) TaxID=645133 RepID=E3Q9H1_COLGM|nr:fungal specific transcription factor domain-containing protein [Colletotrichum graminicola M1.001]EFQ27350.1 fungal specific transcription factor domain-containing protein [Colletotrichum graminicola M1.001]
MFDEVSLSRPAAPTSASHRESPVSPGTGPTIAGSHMPPSRKQRVALACKRCKRRKQRCDGAHPSCNSCRKANSECVYERALRPHYPGGKSLYISALEERIAFLEARMPDYAEDHFASTSAATPAPPPAPAPAQEAKSPRRESRDSCSEDEPTSLVDGVAYLSLCASGTTDTAPEPFYLGSSSGATIARMIQSAIFHGAAGRAALSEAMAAAPAGVLSPPRSRNSVSASSHPDEPMSEFPYPSESKMLFDVFFDRLHTRWPILDRQLYTTLFEQQYDQGALSIQHRSIMHLVYAISARFLQLMKKPCDVDPQQHLMAAIEPMDYILEQHNLATVQFLLLLAVHGTRSPYGAGAWSQIRYAVTLCIELGLHRKQTTASSHSARDLEIRRRAFWSCYCLDRMTSVVLGRTFAIADRDINVELPSDSTEFWDLTALGSPPAGQKPVWSNVEPFIHIIKLRRIQSRIHRRVYRVDRDVFTSSPEERSKLDTKMAAIRAELDEWARSIPHPPKDAAGITWMYDPESAYHDSRDFFNLQYHKSILSLFTVLLPTVSTSDARFVTTARSAACVCTAYKRLNQQKTLSYTMTALHSCFIAGLTLVYCLWRDRALFSYDALEATHACSQSLTIFGEKWPGAVKYRDIFDALSGSLFKTIVDPRAESAAPGPKPLKVDFAAEPVGSPTAPSAAAATASSDGGGGRRGSGAEERCAVGDAISDAVKEAFMEVDEEAPGGWQGWRMFNEMVQSDLAPSGPPPPPPPPQAGSWDVLAQDAVSIHDLGQGGVSDVMDSEWDFGGLEGLR